MLEFDIDEESDPLSPNIKSYLVYIKGVTWEGIDQKTQDSHVNQNFYLKFKNFLQEYFTTDQIRKFWEKYDNCDNCTVSNDEQRAIPGGRYGCA